MRSAVYYTGIAMYCLGCWYCWTAVKLYTGGSTGVTYTLSWCSITRIGLLGMQTKLLFTLYNTRSQSCCRSGSRQCYAVHACFPLRTSR